MIYLDNAATTKIAPDVFNEMLPYLTEQYGNPGAKYNLGRVTKNAVDLARQRVADFIGAKPEQIIFTSGGTEANNLAIKGLREYLLKIGKTEIITSPTEHKSVLRAIESMCIKDEFYTRFLPVKSDGRVRSVDLKHALSDKTGLVSLMYVNNETGSINPIHSMAKLCQKNKVLFLTDCVQAAGCNKIDVEKITCDFLTISGHKLHAPKGTGALYVKNTDFITPLLSGGSNQELGLRGGTENVAGIVGFGKACELMKTYQDAVIDYVSALKDGFYRTLTNTLSEKGIIDCISINGKVDWKSGKVLNICVDGVDGETLLLMLDNQGVCVSSGSACNSNSSEPSYVLTAMGLSSEKARSSIRVSFSIDNDEEQIVNAAKIAADCIEVLRNGRN